MASIAAIAACSLAAATAWAESDTGSPAPERRERVPEAMQGLEVEEQLGRVIPLDLTLRDSSGDLVTLEDYFYHDKPVILNLGYYKCPMLCSLVISALEDAVGELDWELGEQYEILTVSIDPRETPKLARETKADTAARLRGKDVENGWRFLVGDRRSVDALADATGFGYNWIEDKGQFVHAAVVMVLSPEGKIVRYHYGLDYPASDVKLSLFNASQGKTAGPLERVILSCFRYDPQTGKYAVWPMRVMQVGGVLTMILIAVLVGVFSLIRAWKLKRREVEADRQHPAPTA